MTVPAHIWSANSPSIPPDPRGSSSWFTCCSVKSHRGLESHVRLRKTAVQSPISMPGNLASDSRTLLMASGLSTIDGDASVPAVAVAADVELVSYPSLLRRTQSLRRSEDAIEGR